MHKCVGRRTTDNRRNIFIENAELPLTTIHQRRTCLSPYTGCACRSESSAELPFWSIRFCLHELAPQYLSPPSCVTHDDYAQHVSAQRPKLPFFTFQRVKKVNFGAPRKRAAHYDQLTFNWLSKSRRLYTKVLSCLQFWAKGFMNMLSWGCFVLHVTSIALV